MHTALASLEAGEVETSWADCMTSSCGDVRPVELTSDKGMHIERRRLQVAAPPEVVYAIFSGIGGDRGWFYADTLWLPTIDALPALSRTFINEGMRAGIPNAKARERTITLYVDTARFMRELDIPTKNDVHVLLVDRQGAILWRTTGSFDAAKGRELAQAIDTYPRRARSIPMRKVC